MATAVLEENQSQNAWGGGIAPMNASYGKLMMWFFLLSDAFTFTGLLTAYGYDRYKTYANAHPHEGFGDYIASVKEWPVPEFVYDAFPFAGHAHLPLVFVGLMTFILILSSVTMVLAVEAGHRMDKKAVEKWMLWTIGGGLLFLGCQAWEWTHFIHGSGTIAQVTGALGALNDSYFTFDSGYSFWDGQVFINSLADLKVMFQDTNLSTVEGVEGYKTIILTGKESLEYLHLNDFESGHKVFNYANDYLNGTDASKVEYVTALESVLETGKVSISNMVPVEGANLIQNEYGPAAFGDFFFFITGFHGTHVFSGVIINIIIFYCAVTGVYQRRGHYEMVEKVGLYWHFVDLVWVFVFTFFYLV